MQVGDIVIANNKVFEILGIYLGGVGTLNLVGLKSITLKNGWADGAEHDEMFVPEEMVLRCKTYRRVD